MRKTWTFVFPGHQPWMIWWAIAVHTSWGIALLKEPALSRLGILVGIDRYVDAGVPARVLGSILLVAAVMAATGLILDGHHKLAKGPSLLMLAPQYLILISALTTDLQTVFSASFHGQPVGRTIVIVILGPVIAAALLHSVAIWERYSRWSR